MAAELTELRFRKLAVLQRRIDAAAESAIAQNLSPLPRMPNSSSDPTPGHIRSHRVAPSPPSQTKVTSAKSESDLHRWQPRPSWRLPPKLSAKAGRQSSPIRTSPTAIAQPRDVVSALIDATTLGKETALRIAREDSIVQLKPGTEAWTHEHVRRFQYCPEQPEFLSRALGALVEQALLSHKRRVDKALSEAAKARNYATRAEAAGWERTEEALQACRPSVQHALHQSMRAYALRADKEADKLRVAMEALETETALAQRSHMAAMRLVATQLTAQHDASVTTVLKELEAAEREAPIHMGASLSLLERELRDAEGYLGDVRDEVVGELNAIHASQMDRERWEKSVLGADLATEEVAAVALSQQVKVLTSRLQRAEARNPITECNAIRAILSTELATEENTATEHRQKVMELTAKSDIADMQMEAEKVKYHAMQDELAQQISDLHVQASRHLEQITIEKNVELVDFQMQKEKEQNDLHKVIAHLKQQNAVLRARLVTLHATIHGVQKSTSTVEERLTEGQQQSRKQQLPKELLRRNEPVLLRPTQLSISDVLNGSSPRHT